MNNSLKFVLGIMLLRQYVNENTKITISETPAIAIEKLLPLSPEDASQLEVLNWGYAGNDTTGNAYYYGLEQSNI